jgi:anti-sigma factor RsiW
MVATFVARCQPKRKLKTPFASNRQRATNKGQNFIMACKDLQETIALYADGDSLDADARAALDVHLAACPLCRARLADFQALRNDLRVLSSHSAAIPADLLDSVRGAVAIEIKAPREKRSFIYSEAFRYWLQFRLMPYTIGTAASLILAILLLTSLLSTRETLNETNFARFPAPSSRSQIVLASNSNPLFEDLAITPSEYAAMRLPVANESPSVNPTGALVALTRSIMRGKMSDDEVVVVADVFGNGVARISEVVAPPKRESDMQALEKALQTDPNEAAFLPASYDKRSDVVRVVLKLQRVDVVEAAQTPESKSKNR